MDSYNLGVLTNIIGAVESGGQVYGKRNYAAYAGPYTNTPNEKTITLGWAQNYGSEAKKLVKMIYDKDPETFRTLDTCNPTVESMLSKDWVSIKWDPSASQKKVLISLIDSKIGREAQDELFTELMESFIKDCKNDYTDEISAQMMYCEIRHLGGKSPVNRIFNRCGGDYSLDNIMSALKADQDDRTNSNQVGDNIFWSRHEKCKEFIELYSKNENGEVEVMIANSGHDENGRYSGGKAGDQTGGEWSIIPWYNRPWNVILRFEDSKIANLIAELAEEAANNNNIGYDQNERYTFWDALKKSGYRPKNITVKCEADCSAGVLGICKAVGYLLDNSKMKAIDSDGYTGNERKILTAAGAKALTAKKYLTSGDYLKRGDILLYENHHTAINLTNGSKSGSDNPSSSNTTNNTSNDSSTTNNIKVSDVKMPTIKQGATGKAVRVWQAIIGFTGGDLDGDFGPKTKAKTLSFQKSHKLEEDGIVGPKTWRAGLESV